MKQTRTNDVQVVVGIIEGPRLNFLLYCTNVLPIKYQFPLLYDRFMRLIPKKKKRPKV